VITGTANALTGRLAKVIYYNVLLPKTPSMLVGAAYE
jgi:hypothetical protein